MRRVVEDELLTDSGYRESLAEERVLKALAAAGAPADALATLVNRRLLRIEDRLDMRRVELTHDVLCSVVLASRDQRHANEAREEAERQLAVQKERETHHAARAGARAADRHRVQRADGGRSDQRDLRLGQPAPRARCRCARRSRRAPMPKNSWAS